MNVISLRLIKGGVFMMYGFRGLWMLPMMLFCIVLIVLVIVFLIKYFNKTNVP